VEFTIRIHRRAERDIAAVIRSADGGTDRWVARLMKVIATLSKMPERCPRAAEADDLGMELRELIFGKRRGAYRIPFRIEGQAVIVLRVRHAAQDNLRPEDIP
jgi:plasmid stabilization system protein ParE